MTQRRTRKPRAVSRQNRRPAQNNNNNIRIRVPSQAQLEGRRLAREAEEARQRAINAERQAATEAAARREAQRLAIRAAQDERRRADILRGVRRSERNVERPDFYKNGSTRNLRINRADSRGRVTVFIPSSRQNTVQDEDIGGVGDNMDIASDNQQQVASSSSSSSNGFMSINGFTMQDVPAESKQEIEGDRSLQVAIANVLRSMITDSDEDDGPLSTYVASFDFSFIFLTNYINKLKSVIEFLITNLKRRVKELSAAKGNHLAEPKVQVTVYPYSDEDSSAWTNFTTIMSDDPMQEISKQFDDFISKYESGSSGADSGKIRTIGKVVITLYVANAARSARYIKSDPQRYLGGYSERIANDVWYRCPVNTVCNCFFACMATLLNWKTNAKLLTDSDARLKSGQNLKEMIKAKGLLLNEDYVQLNHFEYYAEIFNCNLIIFNNLFVKKQEIKLKPLDPSAVKGRIRNRETFHIMYENNHVEALLKKSEIEKFCDTGKDKAQCELARLILDSSFEKTVLVEAVGIITCYTTGSKEPLYKNNEGSYVMANMFHDVYTDNAFESEDEVSLYLSQFKGYKYTSFKNKTVLIDKDKWKNEEVEMFSKPTRIGSYDIESAVSELEPEGIHKCIMLGLSFFGEVNRDTFAITDELNYEKYYYRQFELKSDGISPCENFFKFLYVNIRMFQGFTFYGHNAGKFDTIFLLNEYLLHNNDLWTIENMIEVEGSIIGIKVFTVHNDLKYTITFMDSFKVAPMSLEDLCSNLKTKNKKMSGHVNLENLTIENYRTFSASLGEYLKYDCLSLCECVSMLAQTVYNENGLNMTKCYTAPSLALKSFWKNYYDKSKYPIYLLSNEIDDFIRKGYFGGRTEAFTLGEVREKMYYEDFTSLYPKCGTFGIPYGEPVFHDHRNICWHDDEVFGQVLDKDVECGFFNVEVISTDSKSYNDAFNSNYQELPLFGTKAKVASGSRLIFSKLKNYTLMNIFSEEIRYAVEAGLSYKFRFVSGYTFKIGPVFKQFFEDKFNQRNECKKAGNLAGAYIKKLEMNSTYGKFAQRTKKRDNIKLYKKGSLKYLEHFNNQELVSIRNTSTYSLARIRRDVEAKDINVAISAAITSYGRILIHKVITAIRKKGGWVHYCDTDSVITNIDMLKHDDLKKQFIPDGTGKALGSMKNEFPEKFESALKKEFSSLNNEQLVELNEKVKSEGYAFNVGYFVMAKTYLLQYEFCGHSMSTLAFKGFSKKGQNITVDMFKKMLAGEEFKPFGTKEEDEGYKLVDEVYFDEDTGEEDVRRLLHHPKGQLTFVGGKRSLMSASLCDNGIRILRTKKKFSMQYTKAEWDKTWSSGSVQKTKPILF